MNLTLLSRSKGVKAHVFAILTAALALGAATTSNAQVLNQTERYAVTDFSVRVPSSEVDFGSVARDAVRNSLGKAFSAGNRETVPSDTVSRAMRDLGLVPPVSRPADVLRLGDALGADYIVSGQVENWRVTAVEGGRQGQVILSVYIRTTSGAVPVNGAVVTGRSGTRGNDVSEATLLNEATNDAAFQAVTGMEAMILPKATVLSTVGERALINRGARSGFADQQRVIIIRNRELIGEGIVSNVDPDSSFLRVTRTSKGIQPGDKIQVIAEVPTVVPVFNSDGSPKTRTTRSSGGNQGIFSLVLLLVILGFLLLGGRGSNNTPIGNVTAEAIMQASDVPGVKVSWVRDAFFRGNNEGPVRWQVWREGFSTSPVAVADGFSNSVIDDTAGTFATDWSNFGGVIGGNTCTNSALPSTAGGGATAGVAVGVPQRYSVELVYRVDANTLPFPSNTTGGGTGTTTGGTTGGTTTGGTTGTTTTGGTTGTTTTGGTTGTTTTGGTTGTTTGGATTYCYFATARVAAQGQATPLVRPDLRSPADNAVVTSATTFQSTSVRGTVSMTLEYSLQVSTDPLFSAGATATLGTWLDTGTPGGSTVSSPAIDTTTFSPTATQIFWRIGVRNVEDAPGPVADATGQRYVYSATRKARR